MDKTMQRNLSRHKLVLVCNCKSVRVTYPTVFNFSHFALCEVAFLRALSLSTFVSLNLIMGFSYDIVEPQAEPGKSRGLSMVMPMSSFLEMLHFPLAQCTSV